MLKSTYISVKVLRAVSCRTGIPQAVCRSQPIPSLAKFTLRVVFRCRHTGCDTMDIALLAKKCFACNVLKSRSIASRNCMTTNGTDCNLFFIDVYEYMIVVLFWTVLRVRQEKTTFAAIFRGGEASYLQVAQLDQWDFNALTLMTSRLNDIRDDAKETHEIYDVDSRAAPSVSISCCRLYDVALYYIALNGWRLFALLLCAAKAIHP